MVVDGCSFPAVMRDACVSHRWWSCTCSSTPSLAPLHHAPPLLLSQAACCKWQVNTQWSEAVGETPYELAFGQAPKCGLSALPIAASVLKVLLMSFVHSFLHPMSTHKQLVCGSVSPRRVSITRLSAITRQGTWWSHSHPIPPRTLWLLNRKLQTSCRSATYY